MMRRLSAAILTALLSSVLLASDRAPLRTQAAPPSDGVKLAVLLVVDQMRTDYLERYSAHWTAGLKRLMTEGMWYHNGAYPYLNTVTCAGHATISTGRFPRSHGIVMNSWLDREAGKTTDCTADPSVSMVAPDGTTPGGDSAWRLQGPTFAERVKAAGGHVVTMSLKPRSAIMPAGRQSDATVWFGGRGAFVTSTAYGKELPAFVAETLKTFPIIADRTTPWTLLRPADTYVGRDDGIGERAPAGWTTTFPHPLDLPQFWGVWQTSPMSDAYLARLALAALDEYKLGQGTKTDFLSVSFSALDVVGHSFGPNSHEVQDVLARLDQQIGTLLARLDERVGRGKYVVALTSDHGVATIPEQAKESGEDAGRLDLDLVRSTIERSLRPLFGRGTMPNVAGILYTDVYLMPGVPEQMAEHVEALGIVKKALAAVPGIDRVFGESELLRVNDRDPIQRAAALSHYRGRSGNIILIPKRGWIASSAGTTHGTLWDYDQRVPIIFFGAGVRSGRVDAAATPADIAPTLARLTGVALSGTDGTALPVTAGATSSPVPRRSGP
jgi:predicted AlkP superfamily pyrophosphatase or phosphodiesterase